MAHSLRPHGPVACAALVHGHGGGLADAACSQRGHRAPTSRGGAVDGGLPVTPGRWGQWRGNEGATGVASGIVAEAGAHRGDPAPVRQRRRGCATAAPDGWQSSFEVL
jgi:hypothetical protein